MARILVLFASTDGQTARIAEAIRAVLSGPGHVATVMPADSAGLARALDGHDALIVGGGIRYGRFPRYLESSVRNNLGAIAALPNAFFSVSLSAGGPGARPAVATRYVDEFIGRTGWQPRSVTAFGGALRYTRYNPFIRLMMKLIVRAAGGETDTSRDYEYTDGRPSSGSRRNS